jgi:PAS domain S-box-containing protein
VYDATHQFPASELGALLSSADLSATPLGAPVTWPPALRTVVQLMLHSKQQMFLAWGSAHALVYNDAYVPVLGDRHPAALFASFETVWHEVGVDAFTALARAFEGEALAFRGFPVGIVREGRHQEAWFDFTHTPVYLDDGRVGGVLCIVTETTAQVKAERALAQQARRLQQLFEEAPGFMALTHGPEHVYELANGTYRQLIGMRDPVGKSVREALPELEGQGFYDLFDYVYATGVRHVGRHTPVELRNADGTLEERWVDFIFQPVTGEDGSVAGIFIQGSDVTDHVATETRWKEAAAAAANERDRLDAVLDTAAAAIVIADADGKLVGANDAMERMWGLNFPYSQSMDEYRDWKGWWLDAEGRRKERIQAHEWPMARALRGEDQVREIISIEPFDKPGEQRTILLGGAPIRDRHGAINGAVVTQMDITEQVRAEMALRESETKFRAIANAMPQLVWSNLPDGTHDFYNERWYEFTGLLNGLANSEDWAAVVHPDDQAESLRRWRHALATGEPYDVEFRLRYHPTGEYRWCLSRAIPVRDAAGAIVRWMGTCTDVDEQRRAADDLRRASERKDDFLAMLAHELRNPLAPLKAAADLLRLQRAAPAKVHDLTAVIDRQVRHMTDLIDDLLDVSRVTRGLVELDQRPLDVKTIVANAIEQAKPLIEARAHTLHVHMGAAHAQVLGDQTRLVQVLVNLLANSAKYTHQGGRIDVTVDVETDGDAGAGAVPEVRITVADNGSGIDGALLPRVFEIFSQGVRTPDRAQGGLGVGLALVKSLVGLHGGRVSAHSEGAGKGSAFTVALPLQAGSAQGAAVREYDGESGSGSGSGTGAVHSVMVVDDNVDATDGLAALLEAYGHRVYVRYDPAGVVDDARALRPDVFVLDIGLPGIDGFELARRLRAQRETAGALLVALTGYGQAHDRVLSKTAGFDRHFVKPVDIEELERFIVESAPARLPAALID